MDLKKSVSVYKMVVTGTLWSILDMLVKGTAPVGDVLP
jgi:hypothetical protein